MQTGNKNQSDNKIFWRYVGVFAAFKIILIIAVLVLVLSYI